MEWREITHLPGLEINRRGEVRNKETLAAVEPRPHPASTHIEVIQRGGRSSQINVLLEEAFGPGAAEAAGLPRPDMEKVRAARERAENARLGLIAPKPTTGLDAPAFGKRKCTDCGKPTTQYRCERCWKKRRGFGFEDAGGVPEIASDGSNTYKTAAKAARERRRKPAPFKRDAFVPMAPRPALPDRQAEFFKTRESMMEERKYTTPELAALIGVDVKGVGNAKHSTSANPMPGSAIFKVREYMQANGITWEQVVAGPRGRKAYPAGPTPEDVTINALCPPDIVEPEPDPVVELADVVADMEPEEATPLPPVVEPLPLGQAIARELYTFELQEEVADRRAGRGPLPGTIGADMSLEDILGELRRRLPDAAITISLQ